MYTLDDILSQLGTQDAETLSRVMRAYAFAETAHADQSRLSGEPYLSHLTSVAYGLAEAGMDAQTVIAGLLHDILEDTNVSEQVLGQAFGSEVLFMVQGVTKLGSLSLGKLERQAESLRRLLVAAANDIRVVIIKLYDRLHNMQTNEFHIVERRLRKARETLEVYAPIAERLGMGRMRRQLEDLSFLFLDPEGYARAISLEEEVLKEKRAGLFPTRDRLVEELSRKPLASFRIEVRKKGLWSVQQKLLRKGGDANDIHDILAFRLIVNSKADCYLALGGIHLAFRPMPGQFKDYIAFPKPNGYQSLHTTIATPEAGIIEVQVRDEAMHAQARYGILTKLSEKDLSTIPSPDLVLEGNVTMSKASVRPA